ncbi:MAG TPA: hypothetical protein VI911_06695 [Patescibacteria group bacterium]|nr:hypothetical protein [Patescibacteria group bacterium]
MTIIQAIKKIKHLLRKAEQNEKRLAEWCSYINNTEPLYTDMRALQQSAANCRAEIARLRHAIHLANATHKVVFMDKETTIDELLLEATVTIPANLAAVKSMRRKEKPYGLNAPEIKVVLQYDPLQRDKTIDSLEERQAAIHDFIDSMNIAIELPL